MLSVSDVGFGLGARVDFIKTVRVIVTYPSPKTIWRFLDLDSSF